MLSTHPPKALKSTVNNQQLISKIEGRFMAMADSSLVGLRKKSLREQALIALRRAITTGELEQ
ncbi:MAG: hypothetical protein RSA54_14725, partial [Glutamicibacter sp.]